MGPNKPVDTSSPHIDIRRVVKDNHTQILDLFHRYLSSPPDSRQAIVDKILHQLGWYLELDEFLFQEVRRWGPQGRTLIEDAELEHEKVMVMILDLQQSEGDDDQAMDEFFEDMMQSVRALFMILERDLLPLVDRSLDT